MASLFEMNENYRKALGILSVNENAEIVNEDGEIVNVKDYINSLEGDIHDKWENTIMFTKELKAEIEGLKNEEEALKSRRKPKENLLLYLLKGVSDSMLEQGEMKYETSKMALSFRKSEVVNIIDEFAIPEMYVKKVVETKPDKTAIKKAIKEGKEVNGCTLEVKQNLQVK